MESHSAPTTFHRWLRSSLAHVYLVINPIYSNAIPLFRRHVCPADTPGGSTIYLCTHLNMSILVHNVIQRVRETRSFLVLETLNKICCIWRLEILFFCRLKLRSCLTIFCEDWWNCAGTFCMREFFSLVNRAAFLNDMRPITETRNAFLAG